MRQKLPIVVDYDPANDETTITIKITRNYLNNATPARDNISHLIDMGQFFGMLEDAVCMKAGIEMPEVRT